MGDDHDPEGATPPASVINLRRARKARARNAAQELAAANRVKYGRTRTEKDAARADNVRALRRHEGHALGSADLSADSAGPADDKDA